MPSFDVINYSLRPSKSIQRQLVFDGVRTLGASLEFERMAYVGFGSIWFTDFVMAHKLLGIDDMVSMESNEVGFKRAKFNSPYATVRVFPGSSAEVLPKLYDDEKIARRPWMIWLDYDYDFNEAVGDDVRSVIENAPTNSVLLVTFNGMEMKYGKAQDRPERLRDVFGGVVPDDLATSACKDGKMQETLANLATDFMISIAANLSRPGGFVPAFRLIYKDGAPMVTVGGVMPAKGAARTAAEVVEAPTWLCKPERPIVAPHLTIREAVSLQSMLPCGGPLSRAMVNDLGFDLEDEHIEAFERYYRQYPAFAQIVA